MRTAVSSTWYLDAGLNRIGGDLNELAPEICAEIGRRHAGLADTLWQTLLVDPDPAAAGAATDFSRLNPHTRRGIEALSVAGPPEQLEWVGVGDIPFGDSIMAPSGTGVAAISPDHLRTILGTPVQDQFLAGMNAGRLSFPSPVSLRPVTRVHSIYIDGMTILYRCVDEENGLVFGILAAGHHMETVGVLIPALRRLYYFTPSQQHFAASICQNMKARIDAALQRSAGRLPDYFSAELTAFATSLWGHGFHIGHHLWNELTGLNRVAATIPKRAFPAIVVLGEPGDGEAYGGIGALFPELAEQVVRGVVTEADLESFVFQNRLQVMRITGEHVSAGLRARIMAQVHANPRLDADRAEIARLRREKVPVVALGFRVENRTVADFQTFAVRIAEHLQNRLGRVALVLDGHNARADEAVPGSYPSHREFTAAEQPAEVEKRIAQALQAQFAGSSVAIIDNIARPMSAGLLWLDAAEFFVAPWGAGLAKYRWVVNKPGAIVSSRWVLTRKGDLHIYDLERNMDTPTPVLFIDAADVFDLADAPVLVQINEPEDPMYYNFKVNMNRLYGLIDQLIGMTSLQAAAE